MLRRICIARTLFSLFTAAVVLLPAAWSAAADFEVTPFAGYTMGGEFHDAVTGQALSFNDASSYGIMLDLKQAEDSWIELYYSLQHTSLKADQGPFFGNPLFDVSIEYFHLGGTYGQATGKVRPFVVGTIGATYMDPKGAGLNPETKFSLSLGGGVKFYLSEHVGIRLDARWFGTFIGGSGSVFCSEGKCLIDVQGDVLSQFSANAGVILAF
jgi:opacity protein-like surface antigen